MVDRINSGLYYEILLSNISDYETKELIWKLRKYTSELEKVVFAPPRDPLVQEWYDKKLIKYE